MAVRVVYFFLKPTYQGTLSRLEAGQQLNPTLDTLSRYALALGRGLALSFPLLEQVRKDNSRRVLYG